MFDREEVESYSPPVDIAPERHATSTAVFLGAQGGLFTDGHHIVFWTGDLGETKLVNLVLLCRRHHRLVHEHGFIVHRSANGNFQDTLRARHRRS